MKLSLPLPARRFTSGFTIRNLLALLWLALALPGIVRADEEAAPGVRRNLAKLRYDGWKVETLTNRHVCTHPDLKVPVTISRAPKRHPLMEGFNHLVAATGKIKPGRRDEAKDLLRETLREKAGEFLYDVDDEGGVTITVGVPDAMLEWETLDFLFENSARTVATAMIRFRERARVLSE